MYAQSPLLNLLENTDLRSKAGHLPGKKKYSDTPQEEAALSRRYNLLRDTVYGLYFDLPIIDLCAL